MQQRFGDEICLSLNDERTGDGIEDIRGWVEPCDPVADHDMQIEGMSGAGGRRGSVGGLVAVVDRGQVEHPAGAHEQRGDLREPRRTEDP